ncbi:MAG TPA: rod shape-determining protein MreD [Ignavibacteria bacterium]|jgi:rod shape-determining protein MreD
MREYKEYLKYAGLMIALIIVQKTMIWLIAVTSFDVTPDLVLIGIVYIGIRVGKIAGSVGGFFAGLILDFLSFSFLGLMALSKSSAGFVAGFFSNDESKIDKYTNSYIFVIIVFVCSLVNNMIYFTFYFQGTSLRLTDILLRYIIPTAVYTAVFAVIPIIFEKRKRVRYGS